MKRILIAAMIAAPAIACAQTFPLEFKPPGTSVRQVQHFFSCPVGARLDFNFAGGVPARAVVGGFILIGRGAPQFLGLYRIESIELTTIPPRAAPVARIKALCTTGLD